MVSKTLHKKQKAIEKQYDNLVEAANRLALTVESDHNIIADSHEYIHRNTVQQAKKINIPMQILIWHYIHVGDR